MTTAQASTTSGTNCFPRVSVLKSSATMKLTQPARVPISRAQDQKGSEGGNVFSFDPTNRSLLSGWGRIEEAFSARH
jgi:hypothetical protein